MKAAIVREPGRIPVYDDFVVPEPTGDEVCVTVRAAALSPLARGRASGSHYSSEHRFPFVAGIDGVGRLDDGRRVYFILPRAPFGAMAEKTVVASAHCLPLPDDLDDVTAAAIANPGMSSWAALTERARIRPGETVLINGATGTSGRLAVKIARHLGAARVIATGRNADLLASLGADATVTLGSSGEGLGEAMPALFQAGIDIVLDYLWGTSARELLVTAARAGRANVPIRYVQIGAASGAEIALPAAVLRSSAIELMGSGLGSVGFDRLLCALRDVLEAARPAGLVLEPRVVPLADVAATWAEADHGRRIVYLPAGEPD